MSFINKNNTIFKFYTTLPLSKAKAEKSRWRGKKALFFSSRISNAMGPKVVCDLTFTRYYSRNTNIFKILLT